MKILKRKFTKYCYKKGYNYSNYKTKVPFYLKKIFPKLFSDSYYFCLFGKSFCDGLTQGLKNEQTNSN